MKETLLAQDVIRQFQERCEVAMLATVEDNKPRIRPMEPLMIDGNVLWMAAGAKSSKMTQIATNPHVELCYMDDEGRHLRLAGAAQLVDDPANKEQLWQEHPILKEYFSSSRSPDYRLIKVVLNEALLMEEKDENYQTLQM